jgi:hypothetical protein
VAISAQPRDRRPLRALRDAMLGLVAPYSPENLLAIDTMMRSSESVQARKQASYVRDEARVFATLRAHWPAEPEPQLRLLAAFAISAVRLSLDTFSREKGKRSLETLLAESFDALEQLAHQT